MDAFLGVLFFLVMIGLFAVGYKKRYNIAKWLEDPNAAMSYDPRRRKTILQRKIEDANFELEKLDEIESDKARTK